MKHILLALALVIGLQSVAQKKEEKKDGEKYFYKEATIETDDYKVYLIDVIANLKQAKFKIKIFNKTNDYLLIKPTEFKYMAGDKTLLGKDRTYIVSPNEEGTEVIDFRGADMLAEKFTVEFKGIYKVSAGGKVCNASDFNLPASRNDFTTDNFTCDLKKADLKTDKSVIKFDCVYVGDGVGLVTPSKAVMIMPDGKENANTKKSQPIILEKGKRDDFTLIYQEIPGSGDMQKKETKVKWNTTFRESKLLPIGNAKLELVRDPEKK